MATNVNWPSIGGTTYSVPASGEVNWAALSNYLIALAGAQSVTSQKIAIRTATTSPVTVASATDCVILTKLSVAGVVTVNLPAGVDGQYFSIIDATGDAGTNNVTIVPNGAETINGAASVVLNVNNAGVVLVYRSSATNWSIMAEFSNFVTSTIPRNKIALGTPDHVLINSGTGAMSSEAQLAGTRGGTGVSSTATYPTSGVVVTEAGTQTLTNKTIDGASNTLTVLAGSQITGQLPTANGGTGQNSSATFPTSGVVVTEAASETLTNKTINGSSNTLTVLAGTQLSGATPIANGGTGQTTANPAFNALSPLTTKGDLVAFSTINDRLPVGANDFVLTADSTQTLGVKWAANAAAALVTQSTAGLVASAGQLLGTNTNDSASAGNVGQTLENSVSTYTNNASTTGYFATACTVTLTPGDWDVCGMLDLTNGSPATSLLAAFLSTNNSNDNTGNLYPTLVYIDTGVPATRPNAGFSLPSVRVSVATATTQAIYVKGFSDNSSGTPQHKAFIHARRMR